MPTTIADLKKFYANKYANEAKLAKAQADTRAKMELLHKAAKLGIGVLSAAKAPVAAPEVKLVTIDPNKMTKAEMAKARNDNFWAQRGAEAPAFVPDNGALNKDEPAVVIKPADPALAKAEKGTGAKAPQQRVIESTLTKAEAAKKKLADFWAKKNESGPGFSPEE